MATGDQIKNLIRAHYQNDISRFQSVALQIAANESKKSHHKLAKEIKEIIEKGSPVQKNYDKNGMNISQKDDINGSLQLKFTSVNKHEIVFSDSVRSNLNKVINEHKNINSLREFGLNPRRKLLFHGLPGTGKTMSAAMIATELDMPFYAILLDGLISKYMGETAARLRAIFNFISNNKAVYLFDEFDSIGTDRSSANDLGEIKRVLNSFLIFFEEEDSESIVIAATNHVQSLDKALFRRFDDIIEFGLPGQREIQQLIENKFILFDFLVKNWQEIFDSAKGLSYAEISNACDDAAKDAVLNNKNNVIEGFLIKSLKTKIRL
ncbi:MULTISPECIES: AAA family ATPase [unclassified Psychrobacter]|uniref:AAA family ATPase n=1 Tax=unclassified Psychrobacter TaxID=196806 RepID=UPI000C339112|nr:MULTISPECIES: ATP-binding protein [unclassified Psychrobacter]MBA6243789.1 ATP-binding protein [Psychrobacter sp. Urea-trap-18]MBA6285372.1 ATP-binding protein [Psychrobacter sp. Urea-trap-16]MBA6319108.1 ATP-binding protein [Psychrobacter sp. Urea-trap-20]MBA6335127.1 ATP-binding protein [Psychrobacter sp. Urea-trap-19]PKG59503.1 AAA family ATPase [Psychrobacter sp. Choline-3u-12]